MKAVREVKSEDCVGDGLIREYQLDEQVTLDFLAYLGNFGQITVLEGLSKPFYTFDKEGYFAIKGLVGEEVIKVVYREGDIERAVRYLHALISGYDPRGKKSRPMREGG
jgi:hypothetical protein